MKAVLSNDGKASLTFCGYVRWIACLSRVRWKSHARFWGGESLEGATYPD